MKKLLFITWDGPQTSYMEGLFMPIFQEVKKQDPNWEFHVLQFTWGNQERVAQTKKEADKLGFFYQSAPISRKPVASVGSFITLFKGSSKIEKYIREHHIDVVMPRSTFPAFMVNQIKNKNFKIIFDADGLPIEERVDFSGLKQKSFMYRFLKAAEIGLLNSADRVITRSQKSIDIHLQHIGEEFRNKFSVVFNGRNSDFFIKDSKSRFEARERLAIVNDELLFTYCGSLGKQYCWDEMIVIFENYRKNNPAKFLILTGNTEFALERLTEKQKDFIFVKKVPFTEIPFWLSSADIAFALREPSFSMQGVAPIKLGEYLLMNLPVLASKGIGDSEEILKKIENCFLYDHSVDLQIQNQQILKWLDAIHLNKEIDTRTKALHYFSLEAAADSYIKALKNVS